MAFSIELKGFFFSTPFRRSSDMKLNMLLTAMTTGKTFRSRWIWWMAFASLRISSFRMKDVELWKNFEWTFCRTFFRDIGWKAVTGNVSNNEVMVLPWARRIISLNLCYGESRTMTLLHDSRSKKMFSDEGIWRRPEGKERKQSDRERSS